MKGERIKFDVMEWDFSCSIESCDGVGCVCVCCVVCCGPVVVFFSLVICCELDVDGCVVCMSDIVIVLVGSHNHVAMVW